MAITSIILIIIFLFSSSKQFPFIQFIHSFPDPQFPDFWLWLKSDLKSKNGGGNIIM